MFLGQFLAVYINGCFRFFGTICDMSENWQMQMVGIFRETYLDYLSVTGVHNGFID